VLQDNLARALYRRGELGGAIKAYHELLDAYLRSDAKKLRSQLGEDFTEAEFVNVYRNLAMAYYSLGVTDEAACYSALAYIIGSNVYEAGRHARLLFSMNKENIALSVLRNTVIARQGNVPAKILLDYGIALFLSGDYTLSQASLSRVLQQTGGTRVDRRTARLLKFSIAQETGGSNKEQESLYEGLLEEDSRFCERTDLDQDNYWPVRLDEIIAGLQSELCDEEKQSFLSN
jgi:tetratricopeptide (TPR) repeat protein